MFYRYHGHFILKVFFFFYSRTRLVLVKEQEIIFFVGGKEENTFQLGFLLAKSILHGETRWKNLAHSAFVGDIT